MCYIFTNKSSAEKHEILEQLYSNYAKLMYYIAYEILKDQFLAEDAVQTAFLKLEKNNSELIRFPVIKPRLLWLS
jgi:RNA polymerase sigma-70 factor (ECF subfamily)